MHKLLILGAGRMGTLTAYQLAKTKDYQVVLVDQYPPNECHHCLLKQFHNMAYEQLNITDRAALEKKLEAHAIDSIVSCLPFTLNQPVIKLASELNLNYFDLTEDVESTEAVVTLSKNKTAAFVPQCGIAPGFINIIANGLIQEFDHVDTVKLSVGALPLRTNHALQYALNWSTEGLINEYIKPCDVIQNGASVTVPALSGLETLMLDGKIYEFFYTSGGVGSLIKSYHGRVKNLSYKTIRYPGHCEKMKFLLQDLNLQNHPELLKKILEDSVPTTEEDMVLIYVTVTGDKDTLIHETSFSQRFYAKTEAGFVWTAIQMTTTTALCAVIDIVLNNKTDYQGFIRQEDFPLKIFFANRFGQYFQPKND